MGGVPVKHHTKSKVGRRRSQQGIVKQVLIACPDCGSALLPHRFCGNCGYYKGRVIKEPRLKIKK